MAISRGKLLETKPIRAPRAQEEPSADGGLRVSVQVKRMWWFKLPANTRKTFELDEVGRFVWEQCDGRHTIQTIIEEVAQKYRLNLREAEVATLKFFEMLSRKRLIGVSTR